MQSLPSIARQDYPRLEVIIVDNASTDNSIHYITEHFPAMMCISAETNLHYTKAMNRGIAKSRGGLLLLMNNDVVLDPRFVSKMVAAVLDDLDAGIFGPKIVFHGTSFIQYAAGRTYLQSQMVPFSLYDRVQSVDTVSGAVWMIRRPVIEQLGLLDEENFTAYYDETDFQARARKSGIKIIYVPSAVASHFDSATFKLWSESQVYHFTRGHLSFALIHLSFRETLLRLVKALGASAIDIVVGRATGRRALLARARLFALLRSLENLPKTIRRRVQLRRSLKPPGDTA